MKKPESTQFEVLAQKTGHVGEALTVDLKGGGGTGYVWKPKDPLPGTVKMDKEYIVPDPEQGMGGMGRERLTFMFSQPGHYEFEFGFSSPSGNRVAEMKKLKFEIK